MRVILIVLDSVGIGALPDAGLYGDEGSDTLGNVARAVGSLDLRHLALLGLGNLAPAVVPPGLGRHASGGAAETPVPITRPTIPGVPPMSPLGVCGRMATKSPGKDTTTGHWEMCGIILDKPFRTYPQGFPRQIIEEFEARIGRRVLGNKVASGTEIIKELGEEHIRTGRPIVYTSADSVFQVACHEEVVSLDDLYAWCLAAREMLTGDDRVSRVIARPFTGRPGAFARTPNRRDFSLPPLRHTLLDYARASGVRVTAIGKISDIFAGQGVDRAIHTAGNAEGVEAILRVMEDGFGAGPGARSEELVFANLVDFDMLYGHRNDAQGFARALQEFDDALPGILSLLREDDILIVTADHGCDPTTPSTDHSREYVPLMMYGEALRSGIILKDRESLADLGATCAEIMGIRYGGQGTSFAAEVLS